VGGGKTALLDISSGLVAEKQSLIFPQRLGSHIKCCSTKEDRIQDNHDCRWGVLWGDRSL